LSGMTLNYPLEHVNSTSPYGHKSTLSGVALPLHCLF